MSAFHTFTLFCTSVHRFPFLSLQLHNLSLYSRFETVLCYKFFPLRTIARPTLRTFFADSRRKSFSFYCVFFEWFSAADYRSKLSTHQLERSLRYALCHIFTARAYARAVLGVVILSVRLSVCQLHAWIVTKLNDALQIFLYRTKGQSLCYTIPYHTIFV